MDLIINQEHEPEMNEITSYIDNPLWQDLMEHLQTVYQVKPTIQYSRCSMLKGWNVKYKKSGRALCTLYPKQSFFIAMVVIGEREVQETEFILPTLTEFTQNLYRNTQVCMGQRWLIINVTDSQVLGDVKQLIEIRVKSKKIAKNV